MRTSWRGRGARVAGALASVAGAIVGCAVSLPVSGQSTPYGPLAYQEGAPLQRISFTAVAEEADPVGRGVVLSQVWLGYSNVFEADSTATHVLFMDMERLLTSTSVRIGVSDRWEVGTRLNFVTTGGGALDPIVSWFHSTLRLSDGDRHRYPENGYRQLLEGPGQDVVLDVPRHTLALEDVRLFAKWRALSSLDGRRTLSLRAAVRVPTATYLLGAERTDVAVMALARASRDKWHFHGMMGGSTVRASADRGDILSHGSAFLLLAAERSLGSTWSGVVQYSVATPVMRSFNDREIDWPAASLVFGAAGGWGAAWRWDVSFQEDVPPNSPSVDFTLGVRVSRSW